jgi:hypothetical protein
VFKTENAKKSSGRVQDSGEKAARFEKQKYFDEGPQTPKITPNANEKLTEPRSKSKSKKELI